MGDNVDQLTKKFSKPTTLVTALIVVGLIIVMIIAIFGRATPVEELSRPNLANGEEIKVRRGDRTFTLDKRKGVAEFRTSEYVFFENWEEDKVDAFFNYIEENAQNTTEFFGGEGGFFGVSYSNGQEQAAGLGGNDELLGIVFDSFDEEEEEGGAGSISDYFDEDEPTPTPIGGGQNGNGQGGNGEGSGDPLCPFWRLNYCIYPFATPTPILVTTPVSEVPYVFDCTLGQELVSDRTIISNNLCIKEQPSE